MNLSGTLSDWTVTDLLNVMKVTGKTASLHVKGPRRGVVHFSAGKVVGATLDGDTVPADETESRTLAAETLFVLSSFQEGSFEVTRFDGSDAEGWEVDTLLGDMEELTGLASDLDEGGIQDSLVMLKDAIEEPVTVQVEDWWAIASLVSVLSFDQLESVFGRGRAIRLLHTLWRLDLIEVVEDPPAPEVEDDASDPVEAPTAEASSGVVEDPVPLVLDEEPTALDLSELSEPEPELSDDPVTLDTGDNSEVEVDDDRNDESWLDEIAAAAESGGAHEALPKSVLGVSAPASTVLTGAVLDEMRRLRGRPSE